MNRRIRLRVLGMAGALLLYALALPFDVTNAAGGGGVGSSGTGGSASSGGYYTYYNPGWGWRNYSVTDSGPAGGFLTGSWSAAQSACSGYSTNILVFTLSSSSGVLGGRDYKSVYYGPPTYQKYNSTGSYISVPAAQAAYNALPASIRGSSVFGVNVGWFCYGLIPQAQPPIGSYDGLTCTTVWGWAFDPDMKSQSIRVDVQVDGDTKIWRATDDPRPDVNAFYGISGTHGFRDDISTWVSGPGIHTVEPFAIDVDSAGNTTGGLVSLGKKTVSGCSTYTLTPSVNVSLSTAAAGASVGVSYSVQNSQSAGTQSASTGWGLREVTIPAGTAVPAAFNTYTDGSTGCPYFTSFGGGIACNEISTSITTGTTNAQSFAANTTTTMNTTMLNSPTPANIAAFNTITVPAGATPGSRICRVLSVLPRDQGPPMYGATFNNRDSAVTCVLVAASPYVALVGGSSWAGGATTVPYTGSAGFRGVSNGSFSSFGEYGLFATGDVNGFGSGGEFWNGSASVMALGSGKGLTFANTSSPLGRYTTVHQITDQGAPYAPPSVVSVPVLNASNQVSNSGVFKTNADVTINATAIAPGIHAVIYAPNNTVYIAGNITYATNGVTSFGNLPSLLVIAKSIKVSGVVDQIAGSYYATTSFVTCMEGPVNAGSSPAITTGGTCKKQLIVNGAVSVAAQTANSLVLNRSYGGQAAGQPAEIIRMRPEVFLTPYEAGSTTANTLLTTVQETELPSRY